MRQNSSTTAWSKFRNRGKRVTQKIRHELHCKVPIHDNLQVRTRRAEQHKCVKGQPPNTPPAIYLPYCQLSYSRNFDTSMHLIGAASYRMICRSLVSSAQQAQKYSEKFTYCASSVSCMVALSYQVERFQSCTSASQRLH